MDPSVAITHPMTREAAARSTRSDRVDTVQVPPQVRPARQGGLGQVRVAHLQLLPRGRTKAFILFFSFRILNQFSVNVANISTVHLF